LNCLGDPLFRILISSP